MMNIRRRGSLVIAAAIAVAVLSASGSTTGGASSTNKPAATTAGVPGGSTAGVPAGASSGVAGDVKIATCSAEQGGYLAASLTVTNTSSKRSSYLINVAFESTDGSTQLETTIATVNGLEPQQNTTVDAMSFKKAPADFKCRVTDVNRYASP